MQCHSACDFIAVSCHASLFIMISWSSTGTLKLILSHTTVCHMAQSYDHKRFTCKAMETQSSAGVCMWFKEIYSTCTSYHRLLLLCAKLWQKLFRNNKYIFFLKDYTAENCVNNRTKTDCQQAQVCQLKQFTRQIHFSHNRLKTVHVCNCVA